MCKIKLFRSHVMEARKVSRPAAQQDAPVAWATHGNGTPLAPRAAERALYSVVESFPLCSGKNSANNSETPRLTGFCPRGFVG